MPIGGDDFTECLLTHMMAQVQKKHQKHVATDPNARRRLFEACETAKQALSVAINARIKVANLYDGVHIDVVITRAQFENLCMELWRRQWTL